MEPIIEVAKALTNTGIGEVINADIDSPDTEKLPLVGFMVSGEKTLSYANRKPFEVAVYIIVSIYLKKGSSVTEPKNTVIREMANVGYTKIDRNTGRTEGGNYELEQLEFVKVYN